MTFATKFNIGSNRKSTILIAPLDWGLGHASRCIPIIRHLNSMGCKVIIATDGIQEKLLQEEFPDLLFKKLPGYRITFSNNRVKTLTKILWQIPKILISINQEKRWLKDFLQKNKVDAVISDNRFGLFCNDTITVFVTHQLTIKTPFGKFFDNILRQINYRFINNFAECWVPDFEGKNNMGGELSHPFKRPSIPLKFIGRLSRIINSEREGDKLDLLIILSGPEPQRSIFEQILISQLRTYTGSAILVRGLPGEKRSLISNQKNLTVYNHLTAGGLNKLINNATFIISRSGYSTVMDLIGSNKKCIFVPTPGQSEQEYLATYLSSKKFCISFDQSKFRLDEAIRMAFPSEFPRLESHQDFQYQKVITDFINRLTSKT